MKARQIKTVLLLTLTLLLPTAALAAELDAAWSAWENGNVEQADALLDDLNVSGADAASRLHLHFLIRFVSGDYEEALDTYSRIPTDYKRLQELDQPYVEACRHLRRYSEAVAFAEKRAMPEGQVSALRRWATAPLQTSLDEVIVVPFANHPLTQYLPAFDAELNGQSIKAHIDTGGTFLIMGPDRAKALGIETFEAGKGFHGSNSVDMRLGLAESFRLGGALLENVPVATLASLKGPQDFVIFGTNVLQQYYSTMDYPRQRLILSPRGDAARTQEHRSMLPANTTRRPFYMWGDHYMFARGSVGEHQDLTFFIDSGLVSIHSGKNGETVQAAFTTTRKNFQNWGIPEKVAKQAYFPLGMPLGLGPLTQPDLYAVSMSVGVQNFGGVQTDGLLSHAFLKAYAWTIDFDAREYIFASD